MKTEGPIMSVATDVQLEWMEYMVRVRDAAQALSDKIARIEDSAAYKFVWGFCAQHGMPYNGESYEQEKLALREALASRIDPRATNTAKEAR